MTPDEEGDLLALALEAAEAGARELRPRFGTHADGVRSKSSPTDLVSDADLAAEAAVRGAIEARRPQDAIVGEEGGESGGGELRWVIDPLDGTINFLFGIPVFAVSVACEDAGGALAAVVLDPVRQECFTATRSGAAKLDGEQLDGFRRRPAGNAGLADALVATGFSYDTSARARQAEVLRRVLPRVRDIRRAGAAALDLCWCAAGRCDAYYERGVQPWDVAAGKLIAECAGLQVRHLEVSGPEPAGVLVAPAEIVDELLKLVVG